MRDRERRRGRRHGPGRGRGPRYLSPCARRDHRARGDAWPALARGSVTVEGTIDPAARGFALRPSRSFHGIARTGATPVGVESIRLADARRGLADVDAESPPLDVVERGSGWARVTSHTPQLELDAWLREADLGTRRPRFEPAALPGSVVAYGWICGSSHPPARTHARLRRGAPLHRGPERPPFARATSDRSFVVWRPDAWPPPQGWVAIVAAPSVSMHCPPIAYVRADDVIELDTRAADEPTDRDF